VVCSLIVELALLFPGAPTWAQKTEADVFVAQAILEYEEKHYEEALRLLGEALTIDANSVDALYYTGLILVAQQKPAEAIQAFELARSLDPANTTIQFQLGTTYFNQQQYDKAEPILNEVFARQPKRENLGYYLGFMRYRHKNYQGAIQAFSQGESKDPDIQQLTKFYMGLALAVAGLTEQAASALEEANRIRTVSPLTGPADRLRDTFLAKPDRERRLHGELRLGTYYDSNVAVNPLFKADPLVLDLRARRTNTPGQLMSARGEYTWLKRGSFEMAVTGSVFRTHNNEIPFFNIGNYLGGASATYNSNVGNLPLQLAAQYTFDYTTLSGSRFLNRHSATLLGTVVENATNLTTLQLRLQNKDFSELFLVGGGGRPEEDRSANNYMIGLTHIFRFEGDKHLIRIGYQYDVDDAKGVDWFYRGHRFQAGAQYTLPWGDTRLKYDFDYHYRRYPHPNAIFPPGNTGTVRQEVFEQNHVVRIEKPLPYHFTVAADFMATISRANLPFIFEYNRYVSTLSVSWGF
jgi:tetratricopeptide (TPR) repeat protein